MNYSIISSYLIQEPVLVALLIAHFLSDFTLQSQRLADAKKREFTAFAIHLLLVAFPLFILTILTPNQNGDLFFQIWLSHAAIDYLKYFLNKHHWIKSSWEPVAFLLDQFLHISCIFILYQTIGVNVATHSFWNSSAFLLVRILFIILLTKPVNIIFKLFFSKYQVQVEEVEANQSTISGAGALIGQLERLIMGIFLLLGQFTAIGLVFTAKSIARYDKISKNQAFAEYYLIGSLFSIISVLIVYSLLIL
ncbi:DUF3307 domain-containing protein [Streptococcus ruminantium]|uniref:DUF3307 domain-containing protein n=1 Tax=Streptococcus ruminantium TaxID=1917441 RepID=UPI001F1676A4|nr:DUF3307 domain-containing protein [Streptococcus ruminantium]BDD40787.1 hypothetical protein GUT184_10510 [Streptococcus ruminantium]